MTVDEKVAQVVAVPLTKVGAMLAFLGFSTWAEAADAAHAFASFMAAIVSILIGADLFWKHWLRPCFERRGWVRRSNVRKGDKDDAWKRARR